MHIVAPRLLFISTSRERQEADQKSQEGRKATRYYYGLMHEHVATAEEGKGGFTWCVKSTISSRYDTLSAQYMTFHAYRLLSACFITYYTGPRRSPYQHHFVRRLGIISRLSHLPCCETHNKAKVVGENTTTGGPSCKPCHTTSLRTNRDPPGL